LIFEWDPEKERRNRRKHGVSFREAMTAFADPLQVTEYDAEHSSQEDRFVLLGMTHGGRLAVVVHTVRGNRVRLISARLARSHERRRHESP